MKPTLKKFIERIESRKARIGPIINMDETCWFIPYMTVKESLVELIGWSNVMTDGSYSGNQYKQLEKIYEDLKEMSLKCKTCRNCGEETAISKTCICRVCKLSINNKTDICLTCRIEPRHISKTGRRSPRCLKCENLRKSKYPKYKLNNMNCPTCGGPKKVSINGYIYGYCKECYNEQHRNYRKNGTHKHRKTEILHQED